MSRQISIRPVRGQEDIADIEALFRDYAAELDVDLAYQDFAAELSSLPGKYAPPGGLLLLARDGQGRAVGCIGLRPMADEGRCEMKRLYVAPAGRGTGLGRRLAEALIEQARRLGYREMCLDTLPSMAAAQDLYRSMGFVPIAAYYPTLIAGTLFLGLDLHSGAPAGSA